MKRAISYCRDALLALVVVFPLSNLAQIADSPTEKLLGLLESKDKKVVESTIRLLAEKRPNDVTRNEKYKQVWVLKKYANNRDSPPASIAIAKFFLLSLRLSRER